MSNIFSKYHFLADCAWNMFYWPCFLFLTIKFVRISFQFTRKDIEKTGKDPVTIYV